MTELKRLLRPRFVKPFLRHAQQAMGPGVGIAVVSGEQTIAALGDIAVDDTDNVLRAPLKIDGREAGHLLVGPAPAAGPTDTAEVRAQLLCRSLQAVIDAEAERRAVTTEALETYRELSLLHRAAVELNRSLEGVEVAAALLRELKRDGGTADLGAVFGHNDTTGEFDLLHAVGDTNDGSVSLGALCQSRLIANIVRTGKGEIINDLGRDSRCPDAAKGLSALLVVPLVAHDKCTGILVLASKSARGEFSAGDLKQATALAAVTAAALYNAHLFEEVVAAKDFSESILQNLSNGVIVLDLAQRVAETNPAALRILARPDDDLAGKSVADVFGKDNGWAVECMSEATRSRAPSVSVDKELVLPAGPGRVSVNLTVVPLGQQEWTDIGYLLILEDITREKRIKSTMVRFMSDRVVDQLLTVDEAVLKGSSQEVTIMFSDIRRFTSLSERLGAGEMVAILNDYFSGMVDVIFEHGGTLDKFIGDAIMAVFGAPFVTDQDTDNALSTAIGMMVRLRSLNRANVKRSWPELDIGIGLNTGTVVAGTIGSDRRMDYTVIGDHVNLAARVETANKYYGTKVLISEHTLGNLRDDYKIREIDRAQVQGRDVPVRLYEVLDYHSAKTFPNLDGVMDDFGKGLQSYRRRDWTRGALHFRRALQGNPEDRPSQIFLHRCWTYKVRPPEESWRDVTNLAGGVT